MDISNFLQRILATKAQEVTTNKKFIPLPIMRERAETCIYRNKQRDFIAALKTKVEQKQSAVIAEVKKFSPSKGVLRPYYLPAEIAQSYARNGAACISVLTDQHFFQGMPEHLQQVRSQCVLPILRKDFLIDEYQIYEAALWGADCILLIAAALDKSRLLAFEALANELGLSVLVEVHNEIEIERALRLKTPLIGINNRNLHTFQVSIDTTLELMSLIPSDRLIVTESGIMTRSDINELLAAGIEAFLVGETLIRAPDPGEALHNLFFNTELPT